MDKKFKLVRNSDFHLNENDYAILNLLYKPIIGIEAYDLYLTMYSLLKEKSSDTFDSILLIDFMSHSNLKIDIKEGIKTLANFKLLRLKSSTEYELYPPYTLDEYIKSALYPYYLNETSSKEKEYVSSVFKHNFNEEIPALSLEELTKNISFKPKKHKTIPFSFETFKNDMKESGFEIKEEDESFFNSLSVIYDLNLDKMSRLFFEASGDTSYTKEDILLRLSENYIKKHERDIKLDNTSVSDKERIEYLKNITPEKLLENSREGEIPAADLSIIERLREKRHLSDELITLLLAYSLATGDNKIKGYSFFEKISIDWKKRGINDIETAYLYITELYTKTNKENKTTNKQSSEEWFKSYWDEILKEAK